MATRKKVVPAVTAAVVVEAPAAPAVTVPAVIARPTLHVGRTWEAQATRVNDLVMGNPDAPTLVWSRDGLLARCVGDTTWYRRLAIAWRLTGGRMENARIGHDCVTYARFAR